MKAQPIPPANLLRYKLITTFLVMMTLVFLATPYALSRHPGDPSSKQTNTESNRQS